MLTRDLLAVANVLANARFKLSKYTCVWRAISRIRLNDCSNDLSVNVHNGAEKSPRSALSVDVQHAQNLQEPNASATQNADENRSKSRYESRLNKQIMCRRSSATCARRGRCARRPIIRKNYARA